MYRFLSLFIAVAMMFSPASVPARAAEVPFGENYEETPTLTEGTYKKGQVLVTLAAPVETALTKVGEVSFDSHLTVENSYEFGDAKILGKTSEQQDFLSDKTLWVTTISSELYSTEELMEKLSNNIYVVSVEPDFYQKKMALSNDLLRDGQWYLDGTGYFSSDSTGIQHSKLAQKTTGKTPIVAVVDTGIDYTHEDLKPHMWQNPYVSLPGTYGYDYGNGDADPMDEDSDSHGTHCAGIIGAVNNNQAGISGICNSVKLMALKVFNYEEKATSSAIIGAFNYIYEAQTYGANIKAVNCSWGGGTTPETMKTLIKKIGKKGALFIFAAGNDGKNQDSVSKECPYDMNSPYIVTVGASDVNDQRADFSDYGASSVDLFAPGDHMLSSVTEESFFPALFKEPERSNFTSYFSSCAPGEIPLVTPTDLGIDNSEILYHGITHTTNDYFGNTADGSYCANFSTFRGKELALFLDVTSLNLDTNSSYYIAYDMGIYSKGKTEWLHQFSKRNSVNFVTYEDKTYLHFINLNGNLSGVSELFFDNLSISNANPGNEILCSYNVYSGTSMAAPVVSAAVAVLANYYPADVATQTRERLMKCVRRTTGLSGYCKTGGVLDLSKVSSATASPVPTKIAVKKIKLNKKKATLRYKKKLKLKATITPTNATNKKVKWYSSKKKYATVTQKGVVKAKKKGIGKTVKIYAKAKDGSGKKAYCKVKIKKKK